MQELIHTPIHLAKGLLGDAPIIPLQIYPDRSIHSLHAWTYANELFCAAADLFAYDPQLSAWSVVSAASGPNTLPARTELGLVPTDDGGVFVFGGEENTGGAILNAEL